MWLSVSVQLRAERGCLWEGERSERYMHVQCSWTRLSWMPSGIDVGPVLSVAKDWSSCLVDSIELFSVKRLPTGRST